MKSIWRKPLTWVIVFLSVSLTVSIFLNFGSYKYVTDVNKALKQHNLSYDVNKKEIINNGRTLKFGETVSFEEGSIQVKGMAVVDNKISVAVVFTNNTDRKSNYNPEDFTAKVGNETLKFSGIEEVVGKKGEVSPKSNSIFFLNYELPKSNSTDYSMKIGEYVWKK